MKARNFLVNTAGASLLLVLVACGGTGVSSESEFKGAYKAPYTNSLAADGNVEIVIDAANNASIKVIDTTGTYSGNGTVSAAGQLNATVTNGIRTVDVSSLFVNAGGSTSGDVDLNAPASGVSLGWTASGDAKFLASTIGGVYNGDYSGNVTGDVTGTMTVDANADGSVQVTVTSAGGVYAGSGNISNLGTLNIFLNGSGAASGKTLSFKGTFWLTGIFLHNTKHFDGSYTISAGGSGSGDFTSATL